MTEMTGPNMAKVKSLDIQEALKQYKLIEAQLKAALPKEEFKALTKTKTQKKREAFLSEKATELVQALVRGDLESELLRAFKATITTEKPQGQKWLTLKLGGRFSVAFLSNEVMKSKK